MRLQYIASSGNTYDLITDGRLVRDANFHAWEWELIGTDLQFGRRISNIQKAPAAYSATLIAYGSRDARKAYLDALHEDFESDIRNKTPGRIVWGDYYIECFILKSETAPDEVQTWTDNKIEIYCPYPFWIKELKKSFLPQTSPAGQTFLDYQYDYTYDYYYGSPGIAIWQTDFPFTSEFMMMVYGPVENPRILVNGYPYQVNTTLYSNEYLIIDSRENTITKTLANGQRINIFDLRDKEQSVFEPMPGGDISFTWSGLFGFDLVIFNERSEPR